VRIFGGKEQPINSTIKGTKRGLSWESPWGTVLQGKSAPTVVWHMMDPNPKKERGGNLNGKHAGADKRKRCEKRKKKSFGARKWGGESKEAWGLDELPALEDPREGGGKERDI